MKYVNPGPMIDNRAAEIKLNNCGYFKDVDTTLNIYRPENSRKDHHIILVLHGTVHVNIMDRTRAAKDGDLIYFPPFAQQKYCYCPETGSRYYWIHFEGKMADDFAQKLSLFTGIYHTEHIPELTNIIDKMLSAPPDPKESYYWAVNGHLQIFLSILLREHSAPRGVSEGTARILPIISSIRQNPEELRTNHEYAAQCGMSEYHFIRLFRLQTGTTPRQFRNQLLLEKARQLLTDTDLNIGEIAQSLKFDDPLYFSRLFKKHFGRSPRQYRDKH